MKRVGIAVAVVALVAGTLLGRSVAAPLVPLSPETVTARVSQPFSPDVSLTAPSATREVLVDVSPADIETDAAALLTEASSQRDPAAAAQLLLPKYGLTGSADSCAETSDSACPVGTPTVVLDSSVPPATASTPSVQQGRPPTQVYAVTSDLIAVSVAHREGERVEVRPNFINGAEPNCDAVVSGYDRLAHPLATVEATIDPVVFRQQGWDADFSQRTTYSFDINEGLTMFLCAEVIPHGSTDPNYRAQAIVQTADRLVPTVSVRSVTGLALPGWTIEGYLPGGQQCGSVRVPTVRTFTPVAIDLSAPRTLCEAVDALGTIPAGRGVLPFSTGEAGTLTIAQAYSLQATEYTSLDLGVPGRCTGVCTPPGDERFAVFGSRGTAIVQVSWTQGNSNGITETIVGAVRDSFGNRLPPDAVGAGIPEPAPEGREVVLTIHYRVNSDAYSVGASGQAAFLTLRSGDVALIGPRAGQCFGDQPGFDGTVAAIATVGDIVHLSGSVQTVDILPDTVGCNPDWPTSPLAVTFSADIPLEQLMENPDGIVLRIDQPVGADPSVRAVASAILRIRVVG